MKYIGDCTFLSRQRVIQCVVSIHSAMELILSVPNVLYRLRKQQNLYFLVGCLTTLSVTAYTVLNAKCTNGRSSHKWLNQDTILAFLWRLWKTIKTSGQPGSWLGSTAIYKNSNSNSYIIVQLHRN